MQSRNKAVEQEFERMDEDDEVSSEPESYDSMASDLDDDDEEENEAFSDSGKFFIHIFFWNLAKVK